MKSFIQNVLRDLRDGKTLALTAVVAICVTLSGPFSTYEAASLPNRALYWIIASFASLPVGVTLRHLVVRAGYRETTTAYGIIMVPAMGVIYGGLVWLFTHAYPGFDSSLVPSYPTTVLIVALVTLIVVIVRRIYAEQAAAAQVSRDPVMGPHASAVRDLLTAAAAAAQTVRAGADGHALGDHAPGATRDDPNSPRPAHPADGAAAALTPSPQPVPALMRRLPETAHGPIHRLEARNHFVRVVTASGVYDIRLRFADAVDEMDGVAGVCAHRSHWVRLAAVVAVDRDGARLRLRIADGTWIPVSRGYRDRVEAAGLINPALLVAASARQQPVDR